MKKESELVGIYLEYIKQEGSFDYGLDDVERMGLTAILVFYRLDDKALNEEEKRELWIELKQLAEENDFILDFEKINQEG